MKRATLVTLIACLFLSTLAFAQEEDETKKNSLDSGSISSQFDYINSVSNSFQEYKVVKKTNLDQFRENVLDSIQGYQEQVLVLKQEISEKQAKIEGLNQEMEVNQAELEQAIADRDSFSFLGMPIHKNAYNSIMWLIVAGLGGALLFFVFQYTQSHKIINKASKDLEDTTEEFEQHRKNTLDRERKLKRELVDALNQRV